MSIRQRLADDLRGDLANARTMGVRDGVRVVVESVLALAVLLRFGCWGVALAGEEGLPDYRLAAPRIRLTIAPVVDVPVAAERRARWAAAAGGLLILGPAVAFSEGGQAARLLGWVNVAWLAGDPVWGQVHRLTTDDYPTPMHSSDTAEVIAQ